MKALTLISLSSLIGASFSVVSHAATSFSYTHDWATDDMTGVSTTPASGSITYSVNGNGQLAITGSGISYASFTAETITGQTGAYFDLTSSALTVNIQDCVYAKGGQSSNTSGHLGLYVWGSSTVNRLDLIWHPSIASATGNATASWARVYGYSSEDNKNISTVGTGAYPLGTQDVVMTVTSDDIIYNFQVSIGGVSVGYYTANVADVGDLVEVGLRFGTGSGTGSNTSSGLFGDVSVSGEYTVIPEPSTYALGAAGLLGALALIRRRRK
ncbi:MAG: PEP-CTERM sorting domain-containing protein [Puniceicoccales bacterium]|jgi:hypothetical protein|nr:PEP-CTERM sorting domain-containing protein [Puniceicoccales bacterium]